MEEIKKKPGTDMMDKEIVFSKSVKAGKRIYYLDVKKNRKDEMFLTVTESKKLVMADGENPQFEKHKIFLYQEDFEKFLDGLNQTISYINDNQELHHYEKFNADEKKDEGASEEKMEEDSSIKSEADKIGGDIKLNIDF
jgi:hypothetical protein